MNWNYLFSSCKEIPTLLCFVGMEMSHWAKSSGDGTQLRYSSDTVSPQTSQQD
ncbi:MAG: hypothetical protein MJZ52_05095 [Bacteroidales bacterium]|nr:hypothetical protein [Bacteroidales bacterium]